MRPFPTWGFLTSLALAACDRPAPSPTPLSSGGSLPASAAVSPGAQTVGSLHELSAVRLDGTTEALSAYKGKVLLVVNVASECGYTPQYKGLQELYERRQGQGFAVLGFPSNDFGGQEPGTSSEIATFCQKNYGVTFPMFSKVSTLGAEASPVYRLLSAAAGPPKWNFHKYLVGKDGKVRKGFPSSVTPQDAVLAAAIDAALAEPG